MSEEYNDKVYQHQAVKMMQELNDVPKYMTGLRARTTKDLLNLMPHLLKRIAYLEQQQTPSSGQK